MPRKPAAEPYRSAVEHLEDYGAMLRKHSEWRSHQRRLEHPEADLFGEGVKSVTALRKQVTRLKRSLTQARKQIDTRLAATRKAGIELPIDALCARLQLTDFDREVLLQATINALDPTVDHFFDDGISVKSVFRFLGLPLAEQLEQRARFRVDAPLRRADLISLGLHRRACSPEDLTQASIEVTNQGLANVLGSEQLSDELVELSSIEDPLATFDAVVLPDTDRARLLGIVDGHARWPAIRSAWGIDRAVPYGRGTYMLFSGPPGTGKTMTAHAIAHRLGKRVLTVDIPTLVQHVDNMRLLPGLFREARMRDAMLFFDECETLFASRRKGNQLMTVLLTEMERFDGLAVLATNIPEDLDEALHRRILVHLHFDAPDATAREAIWRHHLPHEAPLAADVDPKRLAQRYALTGGEVKNAALTAFAQAFGERGESGPIYQRDLDAACRAQLRPPSHQGSALVSAWSHTTLADVHLPGDLSGELHEFLAAARALPRLRDTWRIAAGTQVAHTALMYGPPGTGKTLCAHAIAGELGRPILPVNLGGVRSKWVGESERNLAQLFKQAAREDAVLLLDEADAILSTRGSDRAAHHDDVFTSTLLTLIDAHPGVVLLTTNRPDALDPAVARRIAWHLAFPMPNAEQRHHIWRAVLPSTAPLDATVDLHQLAASYPLSGGDIRTIALRAAARALAQESAISQRTLSELAAGMSVTPTSGRYLGMASIEA